MNSISYIAQTFDRALNNDSTNPSQIIPRENSKIIHKSNDSSDEISIVSKRQSNELDELTNIDDNNTLSNESKLSFLLRIILFIPNLIIIRPLLFTWFIITFPLNLLESRSSNDEDEDHEYNEYNEQKPNTSDQQPNNSDSEPPSNSPSPLLSPISANSKSTPNSPSLSPSHSHSHSQSSSNSKNFTIPEIDEETESLSPNSLTQPIDLKSPTSPTSSVLSNLNSKYLSFPKFVFPRNLINSNHKKTLILDLDETLVHSLSRGTRMNNGHMIEVKLSNQVATLYYVYKRPYCDHFLKQISKWFNLVIFTASVKEYADPVIDWLESERKYFSKRYYRDHCTLRDGQGYIKDLNIVDKNLQNLIIIDNSPISYAWHESNAIIVEGWINDPSDSDLLNLIPLLNGLRFTTDVRSILGLKNGEIALEK
ncbi:CTD small phosphatase-like protein 2-B [Wickerhamomyces ciferrii]|uniref:CTD small phosphatase-like protein 2-B n=1 Tax=Wickerhamomyces ciferrii (strain ATCC 14091 / BCRC 22168 / CBS 111 / JCM 3599 / NBRC 0793 / NRRL Y-1031 F-60-10) TaxID=1206466 RepID=K0KV59_WICCF|nr:CTD small phosphatase-like protein 2-B [Wickerhamomyces ciferrii]CCH45772.1 CTD small phosphatase-like protein 2-B [Wickerhamomyces ciferrii]